jgi:hypothetical protein
VVAAEANVGATISSSEATTTRARRLGAIVLSLPWF